MFVAIEDPSLDNAGATWFPPPFGFPTTCKPIEDWKKTTHYKRITSKWSITWTNQLLDDYTRTIKDWLEMEFRKRSRTKISVSIFPADFTLEGASSDPAKISELKEKVAQTEDDEQKAAETKLHVATLQRDLTAALLYFST